MISLPVLAWQQIRMPFHCKVVSECNQHHGAAKELKLMLVVNNLSFFPLFESDQGLVQTAFHRK